MTTQLPSLPLESIPQAHLEWLQHAAKIYACANSLLFKQPHPTHAVQPTQVPFCLFPSPFPKDQFEKVVRIQTSYNRLYCNMASSSDLINQVLGDDGNGNGNDQSTSISKIDPFIGKLYQVWKKVLNEDEQFFRTRPCLGIFRNDYLLNQPKNSSNDHPIPIDIKQIEFNTVSVSFGSLASKVSNLHRYLGGLTSTFDRSNLPPQNEALQSISKALRLAHEYYITTEKANKAKVVILMIVKPNERNIFDQSLIEYSLSEESIRMIRVTCHEILDLTWLDPITNKLMYLKEDAEVSVVYYRSMYGPEDFLSENDWNGRYQMERSRAINCPDLSMQLVGCKKFQQVLTDENFVKINLDILRSGINETDWKTIKSTWTNIYPLDHPNAWLLATNPTLATDFVLKPQREGGGNNVYSINIPPFVQSLTEPQRKSFILMQLIHPPVGIFNHLIRSSPPTTITPPQEEEEKYDDDSNNNNKQLGEPVEVVCELGIFGFCLLLKNHHHPDHQSNPPINNNNNNKNELLFNFQSGHLLRTKKSDADEGGLAIGISCLDSPLLV